MKRTLISLLLIGSLSLLTSLSAQNTEESSESTTSETVDQALKKAEEKLDKLIGKFGKKRKSKEGSMEAGETTSEDASAIPAKEAPAEETPTYEEQEPETNQGDDNAGSDNPFGQSGPVTDVPPFPDRDFNNGPFTEKGVIGKGPFGTKSATWIKESTVNHTKMNMTVYQLDTLSFDDYGNLQLLHSFHKQTISMMGINNKQESLTISYTMDDSIYSHKFGERRGTKMEHPGLDFYEGMTEAQAEKFSDDMNEAMNNSITMVGTDYVGDKLCQVYDTEMRNEEGVVILRTRIWYWRGIALQTKSRGMGIEEETTTKELKVYSSLPGSIFKRPTYVNYVPFSMSY